MEAKKIRSLGRLLIGVTAISALLLAGAAPVAAHKHYAANGQGGDGQLLANGQLHGAPTGGVMCGGDPAGYGLETAHHGPDAGIPGKADGDGCYMTTGGVAPGLDWANHAIR